VHEDAQVTCCHRRTSHEIVLGPGNLDGICEADQLNIWLHTKINKDQLEHNIAHNNLRIRILL
jgi:hypothetical protein